MTNKNQNNEQALQVQPAEVAGYERAEVDSQVATAKQYPRDLSRVRDNVIAIVTMDDKTAETARYMLPRGGKSIDGPSVHLARIIAQQYGNLRAEARIKQITDKHVVSEAVAWDLETNYAMKAEVRRKITDKHGKRYNDDMIVMTGNAANAIAYRNAVFSVVPKAITDAAYRSAIEKITGDLSDSTKLKSARKKAIDYFIEHYDVKEKDVLNAINVKSASEITPEKIADLRAIMQSIKDGDATPETIFKQTYSAPGADDFENGKSKSDESANNRTN